MKVELAKHSTILAAREQLPFRTIKDVRGNACREESCTDPMTRLQGGMSRDKLIQIPDKWMELMLGENPLFSGTKQNCNKKTPQLKKKTTKNKKNQLLKIQNGLIKCTSIKIMEVFKD